MRSRNAAKYLFTVFRLTPAICAICKASNQRQTVSQFAGFWPPKFLNELHTCFSLAYLALKPTMNSSARQDPFVFVPVLLFWLSIFWAGRHFWLAALQQLTCCGAKFLSFVCVFDEPNLQLKIRQIKYKFVGMICSSPKQYGNFLQIC